MATPTYTLIDSTVLGSASASVTFSSIPADYRDLVLVFDASCVTSSDTPKVQFNNDTGSNYSYVYALGNGSSTLSGANTTTSIFPATGIGTVKGLYQLQIMDYSATDKHKSCLYRVSVSNNQVTMLANRWANTSAINEIDIFMDTQSFATGSTFYLYGIAK